MSHVATDQATSSTATTPSSARERPGSNPGRARRNTSASPAVAVSSVNHFGRHGGDMGRQIGPQAGQHQEADANRRRAAEHQRYVPPLRRRAGQCRVLRQGADQVVGLHAPSPRYRRANSFNARCSVTRTAPSLMPRSAPHLGGAASLQRDATHDARLPVSQLGQHAVGIALRERLGLWRRGDLEPLVEGDLPAPAAAAQRVHGLVPCNGVEPGGERKRRRSQVCRFR